jgi:hypothetical protein
LLYRIGTAQAHRRKARAEFAWHANGEAFGPSGNPSGRDALTVKASRLIMGGTE